MSELLYSLAQTQDRLRETQQGVLDALHHTPEPLLYTRPAPDSWSMAQNLAHLGEAREYWVRQLSALLAQPGRAFGRTIADPARMAFVADHAHDTRAELTTRLDGSFSTVMTWLDTLTASDLAITGQHVSPKFGEMSVGATIQHFLLEHDHKHLAQAKRIAAALGFKSAGVESARASTGLSGKRP